LSTEHEYLGPTNTGTTIAVGSLVASCLIFPTDFQVQFDVMLSGVVSGRNDNIIHVTTATDSSQAAQENMFPAVYTSTTNSLFIQWQLTQGGKGSVSTSKALVSGSWYTVYLTIQQSTYNLDIEVYDSTGKYYDCGTMKFNSLMPSTSTPVYVYASDSFSNAANGKIRNIIFRNYASRPSSIPTSCPSSTPAVPTIAPTTAKPTTTSKPTSIASNYIEYSFNH